MMKRILNDGISIINDKIVIDFDHDAETDILNILQPEIYKSEFLGNIYYFGYIFKDNASRHDRTIILKWLKNLDNNGIDNKSLRRLIDKPILYLNKCINVTNLNAIIYPRSNRSNLTKSIIIELGKLTGHNTDRCTYELVKQLPGNVSFDRKLFNSEYEGTIYDNQYKQIYNYIEDTLIPKIHNLTYFSIADNVKYKYRKYIKNYLKFENKDIEDIIKAIQNGKILLVDDINTSGSTLTEILRIIKAINNQSEIYIFTLIGKE